MQLADRLIVICYSCSPTCSQLIVDWLLQLQSFVPPADWLIVTAAVPHAASWLFIDCYSCSPTCSRLIVDWLLQLRSHVQPADCWLFMMRSPVQPADCWLIVSAAIPRELADCWLSVKAAVPRAASWLINCYIWSHMQPADRLFSCLPTFSQLIDWLFITAAAPTWSQLIVRLLQLWAQCVADWLVDCCSCGPNV